MLKIINYAGHTPPDLDNEIAKTQKTLQTLKKAKKEKESCKNKIYTTVSELPERFLMPLVHPEKGVEREYVISLQEKLFAMGVIWNGGSKEVYLECVDDWIALQCKKGRLLCVYSIASVSSMSRYPMIYLAQLQPHTCVK